MKDGTTYSGIREHYSQTLLQEEYLAKINRWERRKEFHGLRVVKVGKKDKEEFPEFQQTFEWSRVRNALKKASK